VRNTSKHYEPCEFRNTGRLGVLGNLGIFGRLAVLGILGNVLVSLKAGLEGTD
jgi:hypothetical protein